MVNQYESTLENKPVEKKEPEAAPEKKISQVAKILAGKSSRTLHRYESRNSIFSK
jgi:hypothetical protein